MDIVQQIARIRELARLCYRDDEFILSAKDVSNWTAGVSNPVASVSLGESEPDFHFDADSPDAAVKGLLSVMEAYAIGKGAIP